MSSAEESGRVCLQITSKMSSESAQNKVPSIASQSNSHSIIHHIIVDSMRQNFSTRFLKHHPQGLVYGCNPRYISKYPMPLIIRKMLFDRKVLNGDVVGDIWL